MRWIQIAVMSGILVSTLVGSPVPSGTPWDLALQPVQAAANCAGTFVSGQTALNDLGTGTYQGWQGGLYPNGANTRPAGHNAEGVNRANAIEPLSGNGLPSATGKYVLLGIGMSNAKQEFEVFRTTANADPARDNHLVIVNAAASGAAASRWAADGDPAGLWSGALTALANAQVTRNQVVAVWAKLIGLGGGANPDTLKGEIGKVIRRVRAEFPNVKLVYLASRSYAGYASTNLSPEPEAYWGGFATKWTIEAQIDQIQTGAIDPVVGDLDYHSVAPWIAWGPYLWANGLGSDRVPGGIRGRTDGLPGDLDPAGLEWACADFQDDGTHPSALGEAKVAQMLLKFFKEDPTACPWFSTSCGGTAGQIFSDVPPSDWAFEWINELFQRGITRGCYFNPATGERRYCPDNTVSRREIAVFIAQAMRRSPVSPCTGIFGDVPTGDWGCGYIERLYLDGVVTTCSSRPLLYCPNADLVRRDMAIFLNQAVGQPPCLNCPQHFGDVPPSDSGFGWIERLYLRGVTAGCARGLFCPNNSVTRREMAVFIIRNFFP